MCALEGSRAEVGSEACSDRCRIGGGPRRNESLRLAGPSCFGSEPGDNLSAHCERLQPGRLHLRDRVWHVATVLQRFASGAWPSANIVVIDPHGEYASALGALASVRSVLGSGDDRLQIPYWALPAADILHVFAGSSGGATTRSRIEELITEARRDFASSANWLALDPATVTADTPIPFDLRTVWHRLDRENRETRNVKNDPDTVSQTAPGDPATLTPAQFAPYSPAGAAPFKGPMHGAHSSLPELLRLGLADPRLRFFQEPMGSPEGPDPLLQVVPDWVGGDRPVSVLDFSGVPSHASELAIGVVLSLLFEVALRSPVEGPGIGRPRPVLVVLEEAHRYLSEAAARMAREAANRIAREGRKYGIGIMLVTQRPSELPDTALAQCGTVVALRLTNSGDQAKVRAALPDAVTGLADVLPSLRTGEAVITGEALILPTRTLVDVPEPLPAAEDPSLDSWRQPSSIPDVRPAVHAWRGAYDVES
jgi:hypothetical protein